MSAPDGATRRSCGSCSLCCTVLRVDELRKLGGVDCHHQRSEGGCEVHARRPGICRAYRCLWLGGGLRDADRPDRLGAVLDLVPSGDRVRLAVREASRGAVERSPRLIEIVEEHRLSMPVHITDVEDVLDVDRPYRLMLPDGEEHRVRGAVVTVLRAGSPVEERRAPWLERVARSLTLRVRGWKLRRMATGGPLRVDGAGR